MTRLQRDQEFSIPGFPGWDFAQSRDPGIFREGISLKFYPGISPKKSMDRRGAPTPNSPLSFCVGRYVYIRAHHDDDEWSSLVVYPVRNFCLMRKLEARHWGKAWSGEARTVVGGKAQSEARHGKSSGAWSEARHGWSSGTRQGWRRGVDGGRGQRTVGG